MWPQEDVVGKLSESLMLLTLKVNELGLATCKECELPPETKREEKVRFSPRTSRET